MSEVIRVVLHTQSDVKSHTPAENADTSCITAGKPLLNTGELCMHHCTVNSVVYTVNTAEHAGVCWKSHTK